MKYIGRDPTDNYQPQDGGISTHHAKLEFDNKRNLWTIYDHGRLGKGSKNGIWLRITYADITQFDFTSSFSIGKCLFYIYIYIYNIYIYIYPIYQE